MKIAYNTFLEHAKKKNSAIFTHIYHPVSYPLSFILFHLGLTANGVSILGILLSLIGGYFIFQNMLITGLLFFLVSCILDFCDGNVARVYRNYFKIVDANAQMLGLLLENLYANVSYFLFFTSLGYYFFTETGNILFLMLAVFAYGIKIINRYTSLHVCIVNKDVVRAIEGNEKRILGGTIAGNIKFFFTRIVDNARFYYISFLAVSLIYPEGLAYYFVGYFSLVFIMNFIKINLTLIRKLP